MSDPQTAKPFKVTCAQAAMLMAKTAIERADLLYEILEAVVAEKKVPPGQVKDWKQSMRENDEEWDTLIRLSLQSDCLQESGVIILLKR